jgi:alkylhydroperoxidase family enzyme
MTDAEIDAVREPPAWAGVFTPEEIVLLELATRLCHDSDDVGEAIIERLRQHWDDAQIAEILMVAGQANMNNRVGSAARQIFGRTPGPDGA